jgi:hypothetical protein
VELYLPHIFLEFFLILVFAKRWRMKLFDFETYSDYGHEFFFQVLTSRRFALLDFTVQWDDYGGDELLPAIQLSIGSSHLCGFYFRYKRFQFYLDVITARPRDLRWYKEHK